MASSDECRLCRSKTKSFVPDEQKSRLYFAVVALTVAHVIARGFFLSHDCWPNMFLQDPCAGSV